MLQNAFSRAICEVAAPEKMEPRLHESACHLQPGSKAVQEWGVQISRWPVSCELA